MRILMISERQHPHIGGVETHVAGLAKELVARGHQVKLAAPRHDPNLPDEEERDGAHIVWLPHTGRPRQDYVRAWRWWTEHRSLLVEANVIHFHSVYSLLHRFGPARLLCLSRRVYLSYHGYEMRHPIPQQAKLYRWMAARLAHRSICVGHYLIRWFHLQPQSVTYGAVTLPQDPPAFPDVPRAVFVGRLAPDTGIDIYLRGLGLLKRRYNLELPLTVCGDGMLRASMEILAREEGVEATFHGFVADPTPYLVQSTVAFVSGFLAILEATALRRPVFSVYHNPVKKSYLMDMPSVEEMLHIAGSPTELAKQVADHLCNPNRAAVMVDRAAAFAATWTWERLANDYLQLWGC